MDSALRDQIFTLRSEISSTNSRRHILAIHGEQCKTNVLKHHFANRTIDSWNALPSELIEIHSFNLFKLKLKAYLMSTANPYSM